MTPHPLPATLMYPPFTRQRTIPFAVLAFMALGQMHPSPLAPQAPDTLFAPSLHDLAFMAGSWNGTFQAGTKGGVIEERYTTPSDNLILGTTRFLLDGRAVDFELTTLRAGEDGVVTLLPYPSGQRSEDGFRLTMVVRTGESVQAVFEAPEHDFPKRVIYRSEGDRLLARIDGGEGSDQAQTWEMWPAGAGLQDRAAPGVLAVAEALVDAFNRHDPEAMAALVTPDFELYYVIEGGVAELATRGSAQLLAEMKAYFADRPSVQSTMSGAIDGPVYVSFREQIVGGQSSLAVYEVREGLIKRVWYYPAEG